MVYLSELILDPRRRGVLAAAGNTYSMHQLVMAGFAAYTRGGGGRVLYRTEAGRHDMRVLVQSERRPNWSALGDVALATRGPKEVTFRKPDGTPVFGEGSRLRFRLRANPTFRSGNSRAEQDRGKRLPIMEPPAQLEWLRRKGGSSGFALIDLPEGPEWFDAFGDAPAARAEVRMAPVGALEGRRPGNPAQQGARITHTGVDFDGVLRVTDPVALIEAIEGGIGAAKAFGFGLLSVAPAR